MCFCSLAHPNIKQIRENYNKMNKLFLAICHHKSLTQFNPTTWQATETATTYYAARGVTWYSHHVIVMMHSLELRRTLIFPRCQFSPSISRAISTASVAWLAQMIASQPRIHSRSYRSPIFLGSHNVAHGQRRGDVACYRIRNGGCRFTARPPEGDQSASLIWRRSRRSFRRCN